MADVIWVGVPDMRTRIGDRVVTFRFAFEVIEAWRFEEASVTAGAQSSARSVQLEKIGKIGRGGEVDGIEAETGHFAGDVMFEWSCLRMGVMFACFGARTYNNSGCTVLNTLKFLERKSRRPNKRELQKSRRDKGFHSCGGEIVAYSQC